MDKNTKNGLWNFYVKECNDKGSISDTKPYNKNQKNSCSDSFFNPYLDAQEGDGIYNFEESNEYSPQIPVPTEYDVSDLDELCKSEEFRVIRYSIGSDEEFITICPSKCDAWRKPMGPCLASTTISLTKSITDCTLKRTKLRMKEEKEKVQLKGLAEKESAYQESTDCFL
ncbi:hypothetical protein Tco_0193931 [Tanacetum coccineum]